MEIRHIPLCPLHPWPCILRIINPVDYGPSPSMSAYSAESMELESRPAQVVCFRNNLNDLMNMWHG
jgi:hypothetical protein